VKVRPFVKREAGRSSMEFIRGKVAPWVLLYEEYVSLLGLTKIDLALRILGCGCRPAPLNAALSKLGAHQQRKG
jgi:hypothetical protein